MTASLTASGTEEVQAPRESRGRVRAAEPLRGGVPGLSLDPAEPVADTFGHVCLELPFGLARKSEPKANPP